MTSWWNDIPSMMILSNIVKQRVENRKTDKWSVLFIDSVLVISVGKLSVSLQK